MKNLSNRTLTATEVKLLRKGGGYAVTPKDLPHVEYITAVESACRNLAKGEALCLRADIIEQLQQAKVPKSNLTADEWKTLKELRDDENIMVLPADKGKCLVIMDREEYINKMEEKLKDETTYKQVEKDPTNEIKEALSKQLQKIKEEKQIDDRTYYKLFPTKTKIPRMYGQPKIHKANYPLREIVDSTGSVAKEVDRYIGKIIQKYVGKTEHYVKNSAHFATMIKDLQVEDDEILVSYDVTVLYPSVPQQEAIEIFHEMMINDEELSNKTTISAENVIKLFKLCVETTYFVFNKKLYVQVDGLAIGASSSGHAADLFMEKLEHKALTTFVEPPAIWKRYVDDTFSKLKMMFVDSFLEHLNSQHPRIKFTTEIQENNKIAFLDTLVHVLPNKSTKITIYRKATHTDQYLDFNSNHHIKQKIGIINTFEHRINELVTEEEDKQKELRHVKKALKRCGHPNWSLNRDKRKQKKKKAEKEKVERRGKVVLPYIKGVSEKLARTFKKYDIETIHKPSTKLKNILCSKMKDKIEDLDKTGAVYYNECIKENCNDEAKNDYVGETDRVWRERQYEHRVVDHKTAKSSASLKKPETVSVESGIGSRRSKRNTDKKKKNYKDVHTGADQQLTEGNTEFSAHVASDTHSKEEFRSTILCTEDDWFKRGVKEAIAIRKIKPTLNKDDGRYHLSAMWDKLIRTSVVLKTPSQGKEGGTEERNY